MFVGQTVPVSEFNYLYLVEGFFAGRKLSKNAVSPKNIESTAVKIVVDRFQKAAPIHQTTGHNRLVVDGPLFVQACCAVSVVMNHVQKYCNQWHTLLYHASFCDM
jgi:hypothetical protein